MSTTDVTVTGGGTVYQFAFHTPQAREWAEQKIDAPDWAWAAGDGDSVVVAVEHRFAGDLAAGIALDGLTIK